MRVKDIKGIREVNVQHGRTSDENTVVEVILDGKYSNRVERYELVEDDTLQHVESLEGADVRNDTLLDQTDRISEVGVWEAMKAVNAYHARDSNKNVIATVSVEL